MFHDDVAQRTPRVTSREEGGGVAVLILLSTNAEIEWEIVWQGTSSTNKWNLSCSHSPPVSWLFCLDFVDLFTEGGLDSEQRQ